MNQPNTYHAQSLVQRLLAISARIIVAVIATVVGFWLVIASTMGPTIAPDIADGGLDMTIRLGMMGVGFLIWFGTAIWLLWLVGRYLYGLANTKNKAANTQK